MFSELKSVNVQLVLGLTVSVKTADPKDEEWLGREGEVQPAACACSRDRQMRMNGEQGCISNLGSIGLCFCTALPSLAKFHSGGHPLKCMEKRVPYLDFKW